MGGKQLYDFERLQYAHQADHGPQDAAFTAAEDAVGGWWAREDATVARAAIGGAGWERRVIEDD